MYVSEPRMGKLLGFVMGMPWRPWEMALSHSLGCLGGVHRRQAGGPGGGGSVCHVTVGLAVLYPSYDENIFHT